ncbi:MAG: type VII toxin-antitoxin system MntA family adenylyltransferase antitoxin [Myxococcota bacterium]
MDRTQDLSERLQRALEPRPEVLEAYLFGSQARGDAVAHSDVDIAVYVDETKLPEAPFGYDAHLISELMGALGSNAVDVVVLNHAPPLLYHRILRDGVRLVAKNLRATTTREGQALSRYCDDAPRRARVDAVLFGPGERSS